MNVQHILQTTRMNRFMRHGRVAHLQTAASRGSRQITQRLFLRLSSPLLLRMIIGRWPTAQEKATFAKGFNTGTYGLPPLLRSAAMVPAAQPYLSRAMMLATNPDALETGALTPGQMLGNPLRLWSGPKIRFLHLEKTAGSSLTTWLAAQFHPLQIDPDPHRNTPPHMRSAHQGEALGLARKAALVWGHYDFPALQRVDKADTAPKFTFTFLRDPDKRLLSLYYYWRANTIDMEPQVRFAHDHKLSAFLSKPTTRVKNFIDNLYVRRLTGLYATEVFDPLHANPEQALEEAKAAIDKLNFIGFVEDFDASLGRLAAILNIDPPAQVPRVNVLERAIRNPVIPFRAVEYENIDENIQRLIDQNTALDREIYKYCREKMQSNDIR